MARASEHIARVTGSKTAGKMAGGSAIVNPVKLPAEKRDSVCAQCHLPGAVRIAKPGGTRLSSRGDPFRFDRRPVWTEPGRVVPANSHFEQLAQSRCWRASQGKLWCGTCHDPHGAKVNVEQRCAGCHACAKKLQNNCVTCHMPRAAAATVQHAAFTDHSIPGRRARRRASPPMRFFRRFRARPQRTANWVWHMRRWRSKITIGPGECEPSSCWNRRPIRKLSINWRSFTTAWARRRRRVRCTSA